MFLGRTQKWKFLSGTFKRNEKVRIVCSAFSGLQLHDVILFCFSTFSLLSDGYLVIFFRQKNKKSVNYVRV